MKTIKMPRPIEAEAALLPVPIEPPEPIEVPEPIEAIEPPATPWFEDLDNHPEWRPPGNPWMRAPDGTTWQAGDARHGLHWVAIEPEPGEPGVWRRANREPVWFDPSRGLRLALDGAHRYLSRLDRDPPPDALERELRAMEATSPAIAAAQRAQLGRPDTRSTRHGDDAFDPGEIVYDRRLTGWGVDVFPMLSAHLAGPPADAVASPFDEFIPAMACGDTLNSLALRTGFGLVVTDHEQFVPGRGNVQVRIYTSVDTPQTWITWIH